MKPPSNFIHAIQPADKTDKSSPTLVLLHGTGGDETSLVPLGRVVSPHGPILSPKGNVIENGMPRFFRRIAEGVFDLEDLIFRTHELAEFLLSMKQTEEFRDRRMIALGYSNGANIAAALLLLRPEALDGAILWRPMVPLIPDATKDLSSKEILMISGVDDEYAPPSNRQTLKMLFSQAGASVEHQILPVGHDLTQEDILFSKAWFNRLSVPVP